MKEEVNLWLSQQGRLPGVLACGVRYPDRSSFTQEWAEGYERDWMERSLSCLSDICRLLRLNGLSGRWLRWSYREGWLYAAERADGTLLALVTTPGQAPAEREAVMSLVESFLNRPEEMARP